MQSRDAEFEKMNERWKSAMQESWDAHMKMKKLVEEKRLLEKEVEETKAAMTKLKRKYEKITAEDWFLHWETIHGDASESLARRKIRCDWSPNGEFCDDVAVNVLPRPAIFVCQKHFDEWNECIDEANEKAGFPIHKKARVSEK